MSARAITKSLTGIPTTGTALDVTGIVRFVPVALLLHPGRSGACRLQWSEGAKGVDGEFIPILAASGGDDPLLLRYDTVEAMPRYIASEAGTVDVQYTVMLDSSAVRR